MRNAAKSLRRVVGLTPSHCVGHARDRLGRRRIRRGSAEALVGLRRSSRRPAAARARRAAAAASARARSATAARRRAGGRTRRRGRSARPGGARPAGWGCGGVRSMLVTSASNQTMSAASAGVERSAGSVKGSAPGRKSMPRFAPGLASISSWISGSGSAWPSAGESIDDELGHGQPERAAELARDDFGDERPRALPGAAELHHVQPVVVGLDEPGQRPALAQGRDVAGGGDGSQGLDHARSLAGWGSHGAAMRGVGGPVHTRGRKGGAACRQPIRASIGTPSSDRPSSGS